jgi:hypothetical protein
MIKGKTQSGFKFELQQDALNNYELVENLAELEDNPILITKVVVQLLGKEQADNLKEHVRSESGIVPIEKMTNEITDIFQNGTNETKNS